MAAPKSTPKDAQVMAAILKDMGVTEYEPRVINQMLEFTYRYVTGILDEARVYSAHAKKTSIDMDDIKLAIQCRMDHSFTSPPPRDFLLEIARQKNQTPLPLIKPYAGPRLPPDRYCLTAPNYRLKSLSKKSQPPAGRITIPRLSVGTSVTSRPATPTMGASSSQGVAGTTKVGTSVSIGQRITLQLPSTPSTLKPSTPISTAVQSVLINAPSLVAAGKNILITTSSAGASFTHSPLQPSQQQQQQQAGSSDTNPLKRKHEDDDDDYDNA
ncbi:transcription initiation factor TFIID subunit 9-like [Lethenteron reissneri]|uniref:transcription initiation factor TFIID subunit 9-like n=1 Tax=Lethenteron reissneri TaxID=7753 RepID=UPI002AB60FF3|nr:transcription initiation factor TFIID subunit 9-like [Lethenteron reissneri]